MYLDPMVTAMIASKWMYFKDAYCSNMTRQHDKILMLFVFNEDHGDACVEKKVSWGGNTELVACRLSKKIF